MKNQAHYVIELKMTKKAQKMSFGAKSVVLMGENAIIQFINKNFVLRKEINDEEHY